MASHLVIPDCQVKPGHDTSYLGVVGKYAVEKQPDTIICLGDFADMPSLSSYDAGKKSFEGRRYRDDIEATRNAMQILMQPLYDYNLRAIKNKKKTYNPEGVIII